MKPLKFVYSQLLFLLYKSITNWLFKRLLRFKKQISRKLKRKPTLVKNLREIDGNK